MPESERIGTGRFAVYCSASSWSIIRKVKLVHEFGEVYVWEPTSGIFKTAREAYLALRKMRSDRA